MMGDGGLLGDDAKCDCDLPAYDAVVTVLSFAGTHYPAFSVSRG